MIFFFHKISGNNIEDTENSTQCGALTDYMIVCPIHKFIFTKKFSDKIIYTNSLICQKQGGHGLIILLNYVSLMSFIQYNNPIEREYNPRIQPWTTRNAL